MIRKGKINLSAIPRECIQIDSKGNKVIWVEFCDKKQPDQYGNDSYLKMSAKNADGTYRNVYLADFRPLQSIQAQQNIANNEVIQGMKKAIEENSSDLPF